MSDGEIILPSTLGNTGPGVDVIQVTTGAGAVNRERVDIGSVGGVSPNLALEAGGNLAAILSAVQALESAVSAIQALTPALGQALKAASVPVTLASDQPNVPVSVSNLPATQAVSIATMPTTPVTGTVAVSNLPSTQTVAGAVTPSDTLANPTDGVDSVAYLMGWNDNTNQWNRIRAEGLSIDGDNIETAGILGVETYPMIFNGTTFDRLRSQGNNADAVASTSLGIQQTANFLFGFNGSSWDRLRSSTTNGLQVDVTRIQGSVSITAPALPLPSNAAQELGGNLAQIAANTSPATMATDPSNPSSARIVGAPGGDFDGLDLLEEVMSGRLPLAVIPGTPGPAASASAQPVTLASDQAQDLFLASLNQPWQLNIPLFLVDTLAGGPTSYRSFALEIIGAAGITAGAITIQGSNSGQAGSWVTLPVYDAATATGATTQAAITIAASTFRFFTGKLPFRWLKIFPSTAFAGGPVQGFLRLAVTDITPQVLAVGQATAANLNLTNTQNGTASQNVAQWAGTALVNAGVAGVPAVGGNTAVGIAATGNPVQIGGADQGGLSRRLTLDILGSVQDRNTSAEELLAQILTEPRVMSYSLGAGLAIPDDLDALRSETYNTLTLQ